MTLLLGVEFRASCLHLTLIDRRGEWLGDWSEPLAVPVDEWWGCHPEEYFRTLIAALDQRVRVGDLRPGRVAAIGLVADPGVVVLDRELAPIHPRELPWLDYSAAKLAPNGASPTSKRIDLAAALRELPAREPRLRPRIGVVFSVLDYVRYRLCGALSTHVSFAWASGLVEPPVATRWNTDRLIDLGYRTECFPPVFDATINVGNVSRDLVERFGFSAGTKVNAGSESLSARLLVVGEPAPGLRVAMTRDASFDAPFETFRVAKAPEVWSPTDVPVVPPDFWYERTVDGALPSRNGAQLDLPAGAKWLLDAAEPQRAESGPTEVTGDVRIAADAGRPTSGAAIQAGIGLGWWRDLRTLWRKKRAPRSYDDWRASLISTVANDLARDEQAE
ncbi:MAG: hypothetical protein ACKVX7_01160 [Planctomycetota bacterium]